MIEKYIFILIFADINECKTGEHNCDADHMYCNNTKGSFACLCKPGYTGDGCAGNKTKLFSYQESNEYQSKFHLQSCKCQERPSVTGPNWAAVFWQPLCRTRCQLTVVHHPSTVRILTTIDLSFGLAKCLPVDHISIVTSAIVGAISI